MTASTVSTKVGESVGSQDQVSAAYGGFNRIEFRRDGSFDVAPLVLPARRREQLRSPLLLCFTGVSRIASDVAKSKIDNLKHRQTELLRMAAMVDQAIAILQDPQRPIEEFGALLDESWQNKRKLSDRVSSPDIDHLYDERSVENMMMHRPFVEIILTATAEFYQ